MTTGATVRESSHRGKNARCKGGRPPRAAPHYTGQDEGCHGSVCLSLRATVGSWLFPENVSLGRHKVGAALQFVCGNLGLLTLGAAMLGSPRLATPRWRATAACSIALGVAGLIATALFVSGRDLGAGIGGMERIAAYPLPIGSILLGLCLVRDRAGRPRMEIS